jgi:ADP-heptose:LPS heptosyltransferase
VEQDLAVLAALGLPLPEGDDGRLRLRPIDPASAHGRAPAGRPYVVLHPTASVPARAVPAERVDPIIDGLLADGWSVVVTGAPQDPHPATRPGLTDLIGTTTLRQLAEVLAGASALIGGNSGPAHLAAAVGTPVVSVFAPVVGWAQWRPWGVATVRLGEQSVSCAGCRARACPRPGQPCLDEVTPGAVQRAVRRLAGAPLAATEPKDPTGSVDVGAGR